MMRPFSTHVEGNLLNAGYLTIITVDRSVNGVGVDDGIRGVTGAEPLTARPYMLGPLDQRGSASILHFGLEQCKSSIVLDHG